MPNILLKILGLGDLVKTINDLKQELESVKSDLASLEKSFEDTEIPDTDEFVLESDLEDRISDYLSENDYLFKQEIVELIQEEVADSDDVVQNVLDELQDDLEEKVRDLFNDASPAPMSEEDIKQEIRQEVHNAVQEVLEHVCKIRSVLADKK